MVLLLIVTCVRNSLLLHTTQISDSDIRTHVELCPEAGVIVQEIATRLHDDGGFALLADYGHMGEKSDTFRVMPRLICVLMLSLTWEKRVIHFDLGLNVFI